METESKSSKNQQKNTIKNSVFNVVFIAIIILGILGIALCLWGAHIYNNYPGMRELHRSALHTARYQYIFGIGALALAYVLTYIKK